MRTFQFLIRFAGSGALATMTIVTATPVLAQDASPAAGTEPAGCTVAPRDIEELVGFYFDPEGRPLATPVIPRTVGTEAELPQGEPVDQAVEEAVNATVAELFACFDAGQYARGFALMTDDLARQTGPDVANPDEDTPGEVRALLEAQLAETPVVDDSGMDDGVTTDVGQGRDIRLLEGGRVGGVWTIQGDSAFIVLEEQDDRWLIDELIGIESSAATTGTPTP